MKLTKEEAIERHRLMWNWISEETLKQKRCVTKEEVFKHFGWPLTVHSCCWCCEYVSSISYIGKCDRCPLVWKINDEEMAYCCDVYPILGSQSRNGWYSLWCDAYWGSEYERASYYAKRIAELPERKD